MTLSLTITSSTCVTSASWRLRSSSSSETIVNVAAGLRRDVAQVQQRHERPRVGALRRRARRSSRARSRGRTARRRAARACAGRSCRRGRTRASRFFSRAPAAAPRPRSSARGRATTIIVEPGATYLSSSLMTARRAAVPAEQQRALRGSARGSAPRTISASSIVPFGDLVAAAEQLRVVLGDRDHLRRRPRSRVSGRRVQPDPPVAALEPDDRAVLVGVQRVAEGLAGQRARPRGSRSRRRRSRAARCRRSTARTGARSARSAARSSRDLSTITASSPPTSRAASRFAGSWISATIWYGSLARGSGPRVSASTVLITCASGSSSSGDEHDDRARLLRVDDAQVVEVDRVAGAADDARAAHVADLRADRVLHLDAVLVGEDHDDRLALVLVRDPRARTGS